MVVSLDKKRAYMRAWREKNRDALRLKDRAYRVTRKAETAEKHKIFWKKNERKLKSALLKRLYGITIEQKEWMHGRQGGKCGICKTVLPSVTAAHVDHNHATGAIRGLLCSNCNTGLGCFKDSPDNLATAISYLLRPEIDL